MTAEVAILSKQCVALAADSAVTTGDDKIFNTVNKLFAISRTEPVGVMFYNSAFLLGIPIETIIKEYRRERADKHHAHLEQYAQDFEAYLHDAQTSLFTEDDRIRSLQRVVSDLGDRIRDDTNRRLRAFTGWGHPTQAEAATCLSDSLNHLKARAVATSRATLDGGRAAKTKVLEAIEPEILAEIAWLKQKFPVNGNATRLIRELAFLSLVHAEGYGGHTGIVVAGFGRSDVFPRLRSFEFHCSGLGIKKVSGRKQSDIAATFNAEIVPFAQSDVTYTFLQGYDPSYLSFLDEFTETFFKETERQLLAQNPPSPTIAQVVKSLGEDYRKKLISEFMEVRQGQFVRPTMEVVASMPKEELAILAEALINLTALKRKASRDQETVGGPTDVAVISKGDGFIWIKRKHYFDPELNLDFHMRQKIGR